MKTLIQILAWLLVLWPVQAAAAGEPGAPAMLLAKELGPEVDPAQYLISEKYDGVRAQWDGKRLRFRSGNDVHAPPWFVAKLPAQALDGELWLARGRFEALTAIVRKTEPIDAEWKQVHYMLFELPGAPGTFAERAERIEAIVADANWAQLVAVKQFRVAHRAQLQRKLNEVVRSGGEGLMLHLAEATYETGRSDVLLKLKPLQDAEAVVIGYLPGKGKHAGRTGALRVRTSEGAELAIGTGLSDALRTHPPPIGATITYTHRGFTTKGLPRFASYLRVRNDP